MSTVPAGLRHRARPEEVRRPVGHQPAGLLVQVQLVEHDVGAPRVHHTYTRPPGVVRRVPGLLLQLLLGRLRFLDGEVRHRAAGDAAGEEHRVAEVQRLDHACELHFAPGKHHQRRTVLVRVDFGEELQPVRVVVDALLVFVCVEEQLDVQDGGVSGGELLLGQVEAGRLVRLPLHRLVDGELLRIEHHRQGGVVTRLVGVDQLCFLERHRSAPPPKAIRRISHDRTQAGAGRGGRCAERRPRPNLRSCCG